MFHASAEMSLVRMDPFPRGTLSTARLSHDELWLDNERRPSEKGKGLNRTEGNSGSALERKSPSLSRIYGLPAARKREVPGFAPVSSSNPCLLRTSPRTLHRYTSSIVMPTAHDAFDVCIVCIWQAESGLCPCELLSCVAMRKVYIDT